MNITRHFTALCGGFGPAAGSIKPALLANKHRYWLRPALWALTCLRRLAYAKTAFWLVAWTQIFAYGCQIRSRSNEQSGFKLPFQFRPFRGG